MNKPILLPKSDRQLLLREAGLLLEKPARRRLLRDALRVGSLVMLTGCDITDGNSAENTLRHISKFNDRVQAKLSYTFATFAQLTDALLEQLGAKRYALYVMDYGAPVGYRLALRHPERVMALVVQSGNAYSDGLRTPP